MADTARAPGSAKPKHKPPTKHKSKPKVEKRRQPKRSYGILSVFFEDPRDRAQRFKDLVLRATIEELRNQGEVASADRLLAQQDDDESDSDQTTADDDQ